MSVRGSFVGAARARSLLAARMQQRVSEACPSGCVLRLGGHEAAACSIKGLPCGAGRLRYRGQENKAHEMKARVRPSGIATTRAMPPLPSGRATRSAAAGPMAATNRTRAATALPFITV